MKKDKLSSESGFVLLGVLLAVAIAATISAWLYSRAAQIKMAEDQAETAAGALLKIAYAYDDYYTATCSTGSTISTVAQLVSSGYLTSAPLVTRSTSVVLSKNSSSSLTTLTVTATFDSVGYAAKVQKYGEGKISSSHSSKQAVLEFIPYIAQQKSQSYFADPNCY